MRYALGIILRKDDSLEKIKEYFDKIKSTFNIKNIEVEPTKFIEQVSISEDERSENSDVQFFFGIAPDFPKESRKVLFSNDDGVGDYYLPCSRAIEFNEEKLSEDSMRKRLEQFIQEQWGGKYSIVDLGAEATNLAVSLSKL